VVQNSGPQIPKHIQEKIFQPFFTTKSPGQGTGLGLSVSRNIAEVHRGALVLDGDNQHPTFIFSLPIKG
jgi:signal transduction histidine kinase